MPTLHDVVVVGAGPGGSAAAAFLARAGLDVILLDRAEFPRDKTCGDGLAPKAVHILTSLGLNPALQADGYRIDGLSLTAPSLDYVCIAIPPHPVYPSYSLVIRRLVLDEMIRQAAISAGAQFEGRFHARGIQVEGESAVILGERGGNLAHYRGRLIILAVGATVSLLRSAGLAPKRIQFAYAARAYFEGLSLPDRVIQIHFDGVSLPGYAWIFPLSQGMANVGAGSYHRTRGIPRTAAGKLAEFLASPGVAPYFKGAHRVGPVKSFPLRTDFHRSRTTGPRALLIGEAAGLVNPFTGEGIDYALDSAQLASECALRCFEEGDFSPPSLARYDHALRARFQRTFVLTHWLRSVYMNSLLLNPLVRACGRWRDLAQLLVEVLLGYRDVGAAFSPGFILRVLSSLRRA